MARTWPFVGHRKEGQHGMAGQGERQESGKDGRFSPAGSGRISLSLLLLAGTSQAALADDLLLPFAETASDLLGLLRRFDLHNAVYFGLFMGLVAFSTTTALLLMRERRRAGASGAPAAQRARGPARRRRPRRPADGLRAAAARELERTRRRAALPGRSLHRRRERPGPAGACLRHLARSRRCRRRGERPRAAQAARRGLSPDRALPRQPLHRRGGPHHRRARDPAPARRDRRPVGAAAGAGEAVHRAQRPALDDDAARRRRLSPLDPRRGRQAALGQPGLSALRRGQGSRRCDRHAPSSCSARRPARRRGASARPAPPSRAA